MFPAPQFTSTFTHIIFWTTYLKQFRWRPCKSIIKRTGWKLKVLCQGTCYNPGAAHCSVCLASRQSFDWLVGLIFLLGCNEKEWGSLHYFHKLRTKIFNGLFSYHRMTEWCSDSLVTSNRWIINCFVHILILKLMEQQLVILSSSLT